MPSVLSLRPDSARFTGGRKILSSAPAVPRPVDTVRFGGGLIDYQSLTPLLNSQEIQALQAAEQDWREAVRKLNPEDAHAVRARIQAEGVDVEYNPWLKVWGETRDNQGKISVSHKDYIHPDRAKNPVAALTLTHELVHVFQFRRLPWKSSLSNAELRKVDQAQKLLTSFLFYTRTFISIPKGLIAEAVRPLNMEMKKELAIRLVFEAAAYRLTAQHYENLDSGMNKIGKFSRNLSQQRLSAQRMTEILKALNTD